MMNSLFKRNILKFNFGNFASNLSTNFSKLKVNSIMNPSFFFATKNSPKAAVVKKTETPTRKKSPASTGRKKQAVVETVAESTVNVSESSSSTSSESSGEATPEV